MAKNVELEKFFWDVAMESDVPKKVAEETAKEIARKMIAKNKPIDVIVELTGFGKPGETFERLKLPKNVTDDKSILHVVKFILSVNTGILPELKKAIANENHPEFFWYAAIESGVLKKGFEEKSKEIAKKMLAKNMPIDEVVEFTRLDRADVVIIASAQS